MSNFILFIAVLLCGYGCSEISAKKTGDYEKKEPGPQESLQQVDLRVGRAEARDMRGRRSRDTAAIKISARDLQALMAGSPAPNDSFIFYLVKYDSPKDRDRYDYKVPGANWNAIRGKSSLLVGYISGDSRAGMLQNPRPWLKEVALYDLGVLCPPPQNCGCEIMQ